MTITKEQALVRRGRIGSSDIAAILNLDPFRSAADVWLEKTGRLERGETSQAARRGNILEPALMQWAGEELGKPIKCGILLIPSPDDGVRVANLDGITEDGEIVEGKTTAVCDDWGEPHTDQVPERVLAQVHHQMGVVGSDVRVAWVPVLMPGFRQLDFRMYRIERNDALVDMLTEEAQRFMRNHIRADVAPADYRPSMQALKRVKREPAKTIDIGPELYLSCQQARVAERAAKEERERLDAQLLAALGDAESARCAAGTVTYFETRRKAYEVKEATFRALRFQRAKLWREA